MEQPSAKDFQRRMQGAAYSYQEWQEKVKSPYITVSASLICTPLATAILWPLDVVKNHVLAGKGLQTSYKHIYSFTGFGFAMAGALTCASDITGRYITNHKGKNWSKSQKLIVTAAPLAMLPVTSALECLKLNSQVGRLTWRVEGVMEQVDERWC